MEINIVDYFVSMGALVPLVVLITDFVKRWLDIETGLVKQLISWVTAIGLCFAGMAFELGMFVDFNIVTTIVYGLAVGLVSNGIFDIKVVQLLLDFILKFVNKKE